MTDSTPLPLRPFVKLFRMFDSIWLGICLLVAIFVYSAIGSAIPQARQYFELNEFQYFNHWLFFLLILLFCINLTVVTVRRIRFTLINLGVLTVHAGLLMLCAGSVLYFGKKIEGDFLLRPPTLRIIANSRLSPNMRDWNDATIGLVVAEKGEVWDRNMPMLGGRVRLEVTDVEHHGLETAARVRILATLSDGKQTEIVMPREGGADERADFLQFAKITNDITLRYEPANEVDRFYHNNTTGLILAGPNDAEPPLPLAMPELPLYRERFVALEDEPVRDLDGQLVKSFRTDAIEWLENWRMPFDVLAANDLAAKDLGFTVSIDGYLPYCDFETVPVPGGEMLAPVMDVQIDHNGHAHSGYLFGTIPSRTQLAGDDGISVTFEWLGQAERLPEQLTRSVNGRHVLEVEVKDAGVRQTFDVQQGQTVAVDGTDYKLTIESLQPDWPLMTKGFENARTSIALVWVDNGKQAYQRSVMQRFPQLNQDRNKQGDLINTERPLIDDNIEIRYTNVSSDSFVIAAGENIAPLLIHTAAGGQRTAQQLEIGKPIAAAEGVTLNVNSYVLRPKMVRRPVVIPEKYRRSLMEVGRNNAAVRVCFSDIEGKWVERRWIPFNAYNGAHSDLNGRDPTSVFLPNGKQFQLVFGREELALPTRMRLERLDTQYYPGRQQPREWTSHFRYLDPQTMRPSEGRAFLNNTFRIGGWTFFQNTAAQDGKSWTGLGVGNRHGVWTMLIACTLISLGMTYAFSVKPILIKRRKQKFAAMAQPAGQLPDQGNNGHRGKKTKKQKGRMPVTAKMHSLILACIASLAVGQASVLAEDKPGPSDQTDPIASLKAIEKDIDIEAIGRIGMLNNRAWRFTTVDSWARRSIRMMYGKESLLGLDPVVSAMEIMFNADAYVDRNIIYIKDRGIVKDLTKHPIQVNDEEAQRMLSERRVSFAFLSQPEVRDRLDSLQFETRKNTAMNRMNAARFTFAKLGDEFTVVPVPNGDKETPWLSPVDLTEPGQVEAAGISKEQGRAFVVPLFALKNAWRERDAAAINKHVAEIAKVLPTFAPAGFYPSKETREAELNYRRMGLIRYSWGVYIFTFFLGIFAVATRYGWARWSGLALLAVAIGLHSWDIQMRWDVLDRIPVANMYEAIIFSTVCGTLLAFLLELFWPKRVFLFAGGLLGFFALSLPEVIPDKVNNDLQTMMPILDDAMLRIHTVLIIASYAVITLAYAVANCYLFVEAYRKGSLVARATIGAQIGIAACLICARLGFFEEWGPALFIAAMVGFTAAGKMLALAAFALVANKATPNLIGAAGGMMQPQLATAGAPLESVRSGGGGGTNPYNADDLDKRTDTSIAGILKDFDLCQRVLLYTATVALFVGIVLGAVWADYSWGRPWGWDPKEVFALNTWLIYAILIHMRFVTKRRALWTAVLSVIGFVVMQFNWWVVNFYIVGLHSYA